MHDTDVLIIGAGPVGTVAAAALAQCGIDVTVCEARESGASDLRASTFHPPTIEILDELGFAGALIEYGLKAPLFHYRERRSGEIAAFDMSELSGDTRFPFRVQCEQHVMAGWLLRYLDDQPNVTLRFNSRALAVTQDGDGATTDVETPSGVERIRSRYVVAADGAYSAIRNHLGVGFDGFTYDEKFLCLSTTLELGDYIENLCYVNYVADPGEWVVLLRAPSAWRVLLPADESVDDDVLLSDDTRDDVFRRLIGRDGVETVHRTIYRVHQRVVEKFNHGRILLAGDAAHLNNPLGGFGMNSGIHDVWNLKDKLVRCLDDGHDEEAFDRYDRQRRSVTHAFIQAQTMQNKELLEHGAAEGHARRFAEMQAVSADPDKRRAYLLRQSMIQSVREAAAVS